MRTEPATAEQRACGKTITLKRNVELATSVAPCGHGCPFPGASGLRRRGATMQAGRSSYSERGGGIPNAAAIGTAKVLRLCMAALAAATLGACAQTTGSNRSAALAVHRQAVANYEAVPETRPVRPSRTAWSIIHRRVAMKKRFQRVATDKKPAAEHENRAHGVASFYSQGTQDRKSVVKGKRVESGCGRS